MKLHSKNDKQTTKDYETIHQVLGDFKVGNTNCLVSTNLIQRNVPLFEREAQNIRR